MSGEDVLRIPRRIRLCFLSNPWHLYPVNPLLAGSRVGGGQISITRSGLWESMALFGVGALENPRMLLWFVRQVHGEAG